MGFRLKTEISFREDIPERIAAIRDKKVWIVCDGFLNGNPLLEKYRKALSIANRVEVYSDIVPDPPLTKVIAGIRVFKQVRPDVILAIGGGSAIDTAKLINYFAHGLGYSRETRFIAMPTTSGTGSEVTAFAVVTDTETNTKIPVNDAVIAPDEAWLDEDFVMNCPKKVTGASGMDALTHALEAMVAKGANHFTDGIADKAACNVFHFLEECYGDAPSREARIRVHTGSCIAGIAFQNAGLGISHALSHQLGSEFHLAHGLANAILLPEVIKYNSKDAAAAAKYAHFARIMFFAPRECTDAEGAEALVREVRGLAANVGCGQKLHELGIEQEKYIAAIPTIIKKAQKDFTYPGNPIEPEVEDLVRILLAIY